MVGVVVVRARRKRDYELPARALLLTRRLVIRESCVAYLPRKSTSSLRIA